MPRYVALLRGINVGRAKRVPMGDLRRLMESLGYANVETLLNSGNVIFESSAWSSSHTDRIRNAIAEQTGIDVPVIVKTAKDFFAVEAENPLATMAADPTKLLVAFTRERRHLEELAPLSVLTEAPEQFHMGRHAAYLWCPKGILDCAAAAAMLGKIGHSATTRNWATVLKISTRLR